MIVNIIEPTMLMHALFKFVKKKKKISTLAKRKEKRTHNYIM